MKYYIDRTIDDAVYAVSKTGWRVWSDATKEWCAKHDSPDHKFFAEHEHYEPISLYQVRSIYPNIKAAPKN